MNVMSKNDTTRALPEWLVVARREFLERVRTTWFIVVTLLGPVALAGLIVLPAWLESRSADREVRIQVVDRSPDTLSAAIVDLLPQNYQTEVVPPDTTREQLIERIRDERIDGFLLIPEDALDGGEAVYEGTNTSNIRLMTRLQSLINAAALSVRAARSGMSQDRIVELMQPVGLRWQQNTGTEGVASGASAFILGYVVMFILYMAILLYAVNVMRSVVLEKTSRVVEIMVSAVKPRALMLGKLLGVGTVGLVQLAIWAALALIMLEYRGQILGWFGVAGAGDVALPSLRVVDMAIVLAYFLAGYFFYAALYAAIGAMVNSDQEAQQAQTPVVLLLIVPVLCVQLVAGDPRGGAAEALTLIPFSSPVLMPMRYLLGGATAVDVLLSLGILLLSTAAVVMLAARIYRVGILMVGKRPSLGELWRWIRYP
jgi:ABC-2 type transport system permease protein